MVCLHFLETENTLLTAISNILCYLTLFTTEDYNILIVTLFKVSAVL